MKGASGTSATLAWIGITAFIFFYVLAYDLWAHYSGHRTMTGQFRDWLHDPVMGPIIVGLYVGLFVGLTFHFLVRGAH
jgi:hypothetical protein